MKMIYPQFISRLREWYGIKLKTLAAELGMSRQSVSRIEADETVKEDTLLERIGGVLGISAEAIKNFNEEAVFNIIANTFNDNSSNNKQ